MSYTPIFSKEKMLAKGAKEGGWAGAASVAAIAVVALLRAAEVTPWPAEHDPIAIGVLIPVLVTAVKMLRNFMQEMGYSPKRKVR